VPRRTPGCDTTFTIRAWSLRAVSRSESAPVSVTTAVICFLSSKRLAKVSGDARPDGRQLAFAWSDVAHGLNPYPPHYKMAFASSILPFPHACRLALRLAFPCGRRTGFPCSVSVTTNGLGALYPPVACDAHDKGGENPCTRSSALLAQAFQHLWLVVFDDVYRAFTWVRHTIHPSPSPSWC